MWHQGERRPFRASQILHRDLSHQIERSGPKKVAQFVMERDARPFVALHDNVDDAVAAENVVNVPTRVRYRGSGPQLVHWFPRVDPAGPGLHPRFRWGAEKARAHSQWNVRSGPAVTGSPTGFGPRSTVSKIATDSSSGMTSLSVRPARRQRMALAAR